MQPLALVHLSPLNVVLKNVTGKLETQQSNNIFIKEEIQTLKSVIEKRNEEAIETKADEEYVLSWTEFPLKNMAEVQALEDKLKAKDLLHSCVSMSSSLLMVHLSGSTDLFLLHVVINTLIYLTF